MMPSPWRRALYFTLFSNIGCTPDGSECNRCRCSPFSTVLPVTIFGRPAKKTFCLLTTLTKQHVRLVRLSVGQDVQTHNREYSRGRNGGDRYQAYRPVRATRGARAMARKPYGVTIPIA